MTIARGMGQYYFTGSQGCGKTTLAKQVADELVRELKLPLVGIDHHDDLSEMYGTPAVTSIDEVFRIYIVEKRSVLFNPPSDEDVQRLFAGIFESGKCVLFVDEMSYCCKFDTMKKPAQRLWRKYRRAQVAIVGTTQTISDISPLALQGTLELHAGLQVAQRSIDRLSMEYSMDPEELKTLGRGKFIVWRRPFSGE